MDGMIEKKELRNFGLIVGGIFFFDRHLAGNLARRRTALVGRRAWIPIDSARTCRADHPRAPLQILDEGRPCHGVDQYQDHSRDSVLWAYHSDGGGHAAVRLGLDAESAKPRQ